MVVCALVLDAAAAAADEADVVRWRVEGCVPDGLGGDFLAA